MRLVGAERPGQGGGTAPLEGVVVVDAANGVAQLAPGAVQDRCASRRQRILGAAVGMVAQHRLAKGGAQLGHRGRRLGAEHLVVIAEIDAAVIGGTIGGHPIESSVAMLPGKMAQTSRPGAARPGHLLIIGGAEEKLRQRQILSRFASLAGGPRAARMDSG